MQHITGIAKLQSEPQARVVEMGGHTLQLPFLLSLKTT